MYTLRSMLVYFVILQEFHGLMTEAIKKPNILFILTDDQDVFLGGMTPMVKTKRLIADRGMEFTNMFTTTPICCPSRSSILTGKYMHIHQTVNNTLDGNCSSKKWQKKEEKNTFASHLKNKGNYTTFFGGKYLNQYGKKKAGGVSHIPPGWDSWNALVGNSVYYDYTLSVNGEPEHHGNNPKEDYLTDVLRNKALKFLDEYDDRKSFFMMVSTPACHAPFTPQVKYQNKYDIFTAPRTPNFYKHPSQDKHWLLRQVPKDAPHHLIDFTDNVFRHRWETLLSVDDMVHDLIKKIEDKGILNNTYIFFSSDNGFHLGQFSLPLDKRQLYEFDIRVPLLVYGPGIKPHSSRNEPVLNIDLAPTFLDIAQLNIPSEMSGKSLLPLLKKGMENVESWRTSFIVEYRGSFSKKIKNCPQYRNQGMNNCFPDCICEDSWNNTYVCERTMSEHQNTILCSFDDNEDFIEAYNLTADVYQMKNLAYNWFTGKPNMNFNF